MVGKWPFKLSTEDASVGSKQEIGPRCGRDKRRRRWQGDGCGSGVEWDYAGQRLSICEEDSKNGVRDVERLVKVTEPTTVTSVTPRRVRKASR